uniref:Uncharacterized protein n=1 Tax=Wuchereria bancrofti TaxID=6293 RepID=A0A1I8ETV9_WUCBA
MIDMDGCEIEVENFAECIRIGLQVISHVIHAINKVKDSCDRLKRQDSCDRLKRQQTMSEMLCTETEDAVTENDKKKRSYQMMICINNNINVVTTITKSGERITGVEPFFVQVDECDAPVETKVIAAGDYLSKLLD